MKKLETVYFAVVDYIDFVTGEFILDNEELILNEDDYCKYSKHDDEDDFYIHWSEKYEVLRITDTHYLIVNYENIGGERFENVFDILEIEKMGVLNKVVSIEKSKDDVVSSIQYFNKGVDELLEQNPSGYTKEENLILDSGLNVTFFDDVEEYRGLREDHTKWLKNNDMEVSNLIETINGRLAVVAK